MPHLWRRRHVLGSTHERLFSMGSVMQALLFDRSDRPEPTPLAPRRVEPGPGSWVDHQPGWLHGHSALFEQLRAELRWREAERPMYERVVPVPRLLASFPEAGEPEVLHELAVALTAHYGRQLHPAHAALYRCGRDSVAMHSDHVGPERKVDSIVVILSLGEPRTFHVKAKPNGAGAPRAGLFRWRLGWGDLLVLGGRIQADFLHGVPKVASALPRMSVMFRDGPMDPRYLPRSDPHRR